MATRALPEHRIASRSRELLGEKKAAERKEFCGWAKQGITMKYARIHTALG